MKQLFCLAAILAALGGNPIAAWDVQELLTVDDYGGIAVNPDVPLG